MCFLFEKIGTLKSYHFIFDCFSLLIGGNDKPANGGLEDDEKAQLLEMCEHRR